MEVNAIYEGDNLEIMSKFPDKSVDLIYADPPFFSNRHYEVIWNDGAEIRAFQDRWKGGIEHYVSWMEPRIRECHRVLKDTGSMYLHCDWHADAHLRILMDNVFGENFFQNEIIWHYRRWTASAKKFQKLHDTILFYTRTNKYTFNVLLIPYTEGSVERKQQGILHRFKRGEAPVLVSNRKLQKKGVPENDVWQIPFIAPSAKERLGYPTQKPIALLERIISASSDPGDVVLDPFCGCGTTLVAAQKLKRRWVGIDVSPTACKLMRKRLRDEYRISPQIIRGKVDLNYIKRLEPFEFRNWVVTDKFLGKVSERKVGDMGIDGFTPQVTGGYPIQVKQSEGVGRNVIDNFEVAMDRVKKRRGYIVAYSFGKGAYEETARVKNQKGLEIILRTVQELLEGKTE